MYFRLEFELLPNIPFGLTSQRFIGTLPLNASTNISTNLFSGQKLELDLKINQSGLGYLCISSSPLQVGLKHTDGLGVETWISKSVATVHSLFKILSKEARLNLEDKYTLVVENTTNDMVRASIGHT